MSREIVMQTEIRIKCLCGREVNLKMVGGQYQNTYQEECECGRKWSLEEQSELLAELDEGK